MTGTDGKIILKIMAPTQVIVDCPVSKIVAEATDGSFAILPRHTDFVTALATGVLCFFDQGGAEHFVAVDEGVLVKCASDVLVSTRRATQGASLSELRDHVATDFKARTEQELKARSALARLELHMMRRFMDLEKQM